MTTFHRDPLYKTVQHNGMQLGLIMGIIVFKTDNECLKHNRKKNGAGLSFGKMVKLPRIPSSEGIKRESVAIMLQLVRCSEMIQGRDIIS